MIFVLDASTALAWCFEDEKNRYGEAVLNALKTSTAIVPPLWPLEVANGLLVGERRERLTPAGSEQFLIRLRQLPVRVDGVVDLTSAEKLLSVGRGYGLTSYDAFYLSLAMQKGCPLATHDTRMRQACKKAGVALYRP